MVDDQFRGDEADFAPSGVVRQVRRGTRDEPQVETPAVIEAMGRTVFPNYLKGGKRMFPVLIAFSHVANPSVSKQPEETGLVLEVVNPALDRPEPVRQNRVFQLNADIVEQRLGVVDPMVAYV